VSRDVKHMRKLRRALRRKYAKALFAGAVDHVARRAFVARLAPSLRTAIWRLTVIVESVVLRTTGVALGLQQELAGFTAVLNKSLHPTPR
jgi:hypothetical protein